MRERVLIIFAVIALPLVGLWASHRHGYTFGIAEGWNETAQMAIDRPPEWKNTSRNTVIPRLQLISQKDV